jgi:hypothetical protein
MKKATDKFSVHEADTAKREYPPQLLDPSRTAKISKADLDTVLRTESGTRKAIDREEIQRHLERTLDEHARPTIDVFAAIPKMPEPAPLPAPDPPPTAVVPELSISSTSSSASSSPAASASSSPSSSPEAMVQAMTARRWLVPVGILVFAAAAIAAFFFVSIIAGR